MADEVLALEATEDMIVGGVRIRKDHVILIGLGIGGRIMLVREVDPDMCAIVNAMKAGKLIPADLPLSAALRAVCPAPPLPVSRARKPSLHRKRGQTTA
jgi:hypothetical protein